MYIKQLENIKTISGKLLSNKIIYLQNILGINKEEKILKGGISI